MIIHNLNKILLDKYVPTKLVAMAPKNITPNQKIKINIFFLIIKAYVTFRFIYSTITVITFIFLINLILLLIHFCHFNSK